MDGRGYAFLEDSVEFVTKNILHHCEVSGRSTSEIRLIAVTKTHPVRTIDKLYSLGLRDFGESYVEEFREKYHEIAPRRINWHYIGHLARKRTNKVVGRAEYIHSVDSLRLAKKIQFTCQQKDTSQKILLQINTSGEETKHGFNADIWKRDDILKELKALDRVIIKGLMTMAPHTDDEKVLRQCFKRLQETRGRLEESTGISLPELSMGMTNDYGIAIEEGATMLRVGTGLLGQRNYG